MGYERARSIPPSNAGPIIVMDPAGPAGGGSIGHGNDTSLSAGQGRTKSINNGGTRRGRSCHRRSPDDTTAMTCTSTSRSGRSKSRSHSLHRRRTSERSRSKSAHIRRTFHARSTAAATPIYEETPARSESLHKRVSTHGQTSSLIATRTLQDSLPCASAAVGKPRSNSLHRRSSMRDTTTTNTCSRRSHPPRRTFSDDGTCPSHRGRSMTFKGHSRRSSLPSCSPSATARAPSCTRTVSTLTRQKSTSKLTDFDPEDSVAIQLDVTKSSKTPATTNFSRENYKRDLPSLKREQISNALFSALLNQTMTTFPRIVQQSSDATTDSSDLTMPQMKRCSSTSMAMPSNSHNTSTSLSRLYHNPHRPSQTTLAVLAIASNICGDMETGGPKILDEDKLLRENNTLKLLRGGLRRSVTMVDQSMFSTSTGASSGSSGSCSSKSVEETAKRMKELQTRFRRSSQLQEQLAKVISQNEQPRLTKDIPMLQGHIGYSFIVL